MRTVLVTGSSGFIGSRLCERLASILGRDNVFQYDLSDRRDITNFSHLTQDVKSSNPDCIFHLAGITTTSLAKENPCLCYEINVGGTANILEIASRLKIQKVVVSSTYLDPVESYSRSKWMAEWLCSKYDFATVLKHCNVYGPGDNSTSRIIPSIITKLMKGERPVVKRGIVREFVFVEDVVSEYISCASLKCSVRSVSGIRIDLLCLFKMIAGLMNSSIEPVIIEGDEIADVEEPQKTIFATPLEEGLKQTVEWYAKHYRPA